MSTVPDYLLFMLMISQQGVFQGKRVLSAWAMGRNRRATGMAFASGWRM
jgi:hypothetical protein